MKIKLIVLVLVLVIIAVVVLNYYDVMPKEIVTASIVERSEGLFLRFEKVRYPSYAIVSNSDSDVVGFDISNDSINFGLAPAGGGGSRFLNIGNSESGVVKIKLSAYGNISQFITFKSNNFILEPGQNTQVEVSFNTEATTQEGDYVGEIDITKVISKNILGDGVLGWF